MGVKGKFVSRKGAQLLGGHLKSVCVVMMLCGRYAMQFVGSILKAQSFIKIANSDPALMRVFDMTHPPQYSMIFNCFVFISVFVKHFNAFIYILRRCISSYGV